MLFETDDGYDTGFDRYNQIGESNKILEHIGYPLDGWFSPLIEQALTGEHFQHGPETRLEALATLMHKWICTFLDEDNQGVELTDSILQERNRLCQRIELLRNDGKTIATSADAEYACCWWATSVLLRAELLGISLASAAELTQIQPRLVKCLRITDLATLWGRRKGLLFWVVAISHLATVKRCISLLTTALYTHFALEISSSMSLYQICIPQLQRLRKLESVFLSSDDKSRERFLMWPDLRSD